MKYIRKHLLIITTILIIILALGLFYIKYNLLSNKEDIIDSKKSDDLLVKNEDEVLEVKLIHVDVKGAVKKPGVYEVSNDKLVIDVVNLAGGFLDNADTSLINLAKKVQDEMVVIIYTAEEVKKALNDNNNSIAKVIDKTCVCPSIKNDACINTNSSKSNKDTNKDNSSNSSNENNDEDILVNINTASMEELENIPGIGESKAKAIISYREENGLFSSIEDIKNVSGIGDSLYEKIKTYITV